VLDGTHARASLDALRRLLLVPLKNADAIASRQRLLAALMPLREQVTWGPLCALAQQVQAYLDSNYVVVPSGMVASTHFALRHRDMCGTWRSRCAPSRRSWHSRSRCSARYTDCLATW
jgi:hypothetical protein